MKINRISLITSTGIVLTALLLGAASANAQTLRGPAKLSDTPKTFDALIFPVETRPQTIRINLQNPGGKQVRVIIQHENGKIVYDEYKNEATSRIYYDLSSLPVGNYVVDLSTGRERISKPFVIEPTQRGYITMGNRPMPIIGEFPTRSRLVVKE